MQDALGNIRRKVLYRTMDHNKGKSKMDVRWEEGIWVGISRESNEAIVGTTMGTVRAYATKRRQIEERWDRSMIADLKGIPQKPNPDKVGIYIPTRIVEKARGGGASGSSVLGGDTEGLPMPAEIP